jgi:hypothetical protein
MTELWPFLERGLADEAAGRVKPMAQALEEIRQRHGFPASWPYEP